jgi:hypothetical protein
MVMKGSCMKKFCIFVIFVLGASFSFSDEPPLRDPQVRVEGQRQRDAVSSEIDQIDVQIQKLRGMKLGYEAKAIRQENQAQRLQFMNNELSTSKKLWRLADANRAAAQKIQEEIDKLHIKKAQLLEKRATLP